MKITEKSLFKKVLLLSLISLLSFSVMFTSCDHNANPKHYDYTLVDDSDFENMEALQFTQIMGNGINLGNTMEAAGAGWLGYNASPEAYESAWGQPKTTKAIFQAYKDAGFDSVRIPVAWLSTMDIANGDYKINENFMAYVENIVQMALEANLIVMINDHWDYGWWSLFGKQHENSQELRKEAYKIFDAIWDQVGTHFKDYPYQLIFEAGNEEWGDGFNDGFSSHGKTYCQDDKANQWADITKYNKVKSENYKIITELAQYFVDKIRDQGSKNEKRFLLIPGYSTSTHLTSASEYVMPKDPTNSVQKLLVSVHYYEPSNYSILEEDADWGKVANSWGTAAEVAAQNACFAEMKRFVDAGYGVLFGEYGVARLNGTTRKNNDVDWITNILDNCDKYNYCPFLWDCNGYFKKTGKLGFADSDIAAIFKDRNYASEKPSKDSAIEVGDNDFIKIESSVSCKAGDTISIKAKISGAKNFNQIGLQTNADAEEWHSKWENSGYDDNYDFEITITASEDVNNVYAKFIFQSLIDESKSKSKVKIDNFTVSVL